MQGPKRALAVIVSGAAVAAVCWQIDGRATQAIPAEKIFENERVIIWNVGAGAAPEPLVRAPVRPGVLVALADGAVRFITGVDGGRTGDAQPGVLIQLKDDRASATVAPPGIPPAFPREGVKRLIENHRVVVWDVNWTRGMRTPLHFHDKDVVAVYLGSGTVRSIPRDGPTTATPRSFGEAVFLPGGRTHVEECIAGPRRDIIIELK